MYYINWYQLCVRYRANPAIASPRPEHGSHRPVASGRGGTAVAWWHYALACLRFDAIASGRWHTALNRRSARRAYINLLKHRMGRAWRPPLGPVLAPDPVPDHASLDAALPQHAQGEPAQASGTQPSGTPASGAPPSATTTWGLRRPSRTLEAAEAAAAPGAADGAAPAAAPRASSSRFASPRLQANLVLQSAQLGELHRRESLLRLPQLLE